MPEKNILITGGSGQLGQAFKSIMGEKGALYPSSEEFNITSLESIQNFLAEHKNINMIINCAAYTQVDAAEENQELAHKINVEGPKNLAKTGLPIVHISTDYVFDGTSTTPYKETDKTTAINTYGQTKLEGENAILNIAENAIIIRTSWLYSEFANNFLKTMCRLFAEKESLTIIADQVGTPTYAGDLVDAVLKIIPQMNKENKGVYHFSNEGIASWYDFAYDILTHRKEDCILSPMSSEDYPTKAKRPSYSVLDKSKIKETFGIHIPNWQEGVRKCLKNLYS